ncbi:protein STPG4 [Neosynchiropus ocellatus]
MSGGGAEKKGGVDPSGRGSWWTGSLKSTPIPGHYRTRDFIEEADLNPVKKTYGFKGPGRSGGNVFEAGSGALLLPGAYDHMDSAREVLRPSCSFRSCPRSEGVTLGVRDKHLTTSPCDYNVTPKPVEKSPSKHVMFRSSVRRIAFPPKAGPAPGQYSPRLRPARGVTSCFQSSVPRLHHTLSDTPGPGAYERQWKLGDPLGKESPVHPTFSLYFRDIPET